MSGRYAAYPEYRDSGLWSCPTCPSHWGVSRIKFIAELNPSKSQLDHLDSLTRVTFLPMEAIGENGELDLSRKRYLKDVRNGYTYLGEGDVCIAKITPCFENGKGAVISGTHNGIAFATTEVIPFRCKRPEDARFLYFLLTSAPFKPNAEASMYGAGGQKRVADSFVGNYSVVLPTPGERSQIAKFLDYETAKIDALIAKQQQLIALLQEKRQAVISHAVTKGLNPATPLRDSGVEWLGEVPAHWTVGRLKHVTDFITSGPRGWSDLISDEGTDLFLQSGDLNDKLGLRLDTAKRITPPQNAESARTKMHDGDVVVCITGANTGRVAVAVQLREAVYVNQHLSLVRPQKDHVIPDYLATVLASSAVKAYFAVKQYGLKEGLSLTNVAETPLCLPPLEEQVAIVSHLNKLGNKLDKLENAAELQVELLQERRTALIAAAVTGKIDVRGWQPPSAAAGGTT